MDTDRSFESNVRNFLAEENSPNCFGKVKQCMLASSVEEGGSDCTNTSETYTIESDFETWNKVNDRFITNININTFFFSFIIFIKMCY